MLTLIIFLSSFITVFWHITTQYLPISLLKLSWSDNSTILFTSLRTPTHFIRVIAIANVCSWLLSPKRNNLSWIICLTFFFFFSFYFLLFFVHLFWHFCLFSMPSIIWSFGSCWYLLFLIFTWVWFHVWQIFFTLFVILLLSLSLCLLWSSHRLFIMKWLILWCCLYWSFYFLFSFLLIIVSFNYLILILIFTFRFLYCFFLLFTFQISIFYLFAFSNFLIQWQTHILLLLHLLRQLFYLLFQILYLLLLTAALLCAFVSVCVPARTL